MKPPSYLLEMRQAHEDVVIGYWHDLVRLLQQAEES